MIKKNPAGATGRGRAAAVAAGLAGIGLLTAACSAASAGNGGATPRASADTGKVTAAQLSGVTLRVGDQAGAGSQALLTAAGLIHKLPFKVQWSEFTSGPPMLEAMGTGSIDIGSVGDAPPVFAASAGDQLAVVGALRANPAGTAILVPKGSSVRTAAQLRGKTIAVAEGSSSDYHLLAVLEQAGLSVRDVTIENLQPAQAEAAFAAGKVAAWDVWSPFIELAQAQTKARILVNGRALGGTYSFAVASRAALADPAKAAAIGDYLRLLDRAHAWANTHLSAWASVWASASGAPNAVMLKAVTDSTAAAVPITGAVVNSEQKIANAFYTAGLIPAQVKFANFADTSFNNIAEGSS